MLDDAFQAGTTAALQDLALRPPAPKPVEQGRFSVWGLGTAAPRGLATAVNEALGSAADVLKAYGTASALTAEADPAARAAFTREQIEQGRRDAKAEIDRGDLMTSAAGDALRANGEYWAPDPVTAHASESLVFDFARVGGKVVGGAMAAGPFGIAAAAGEEGLTQADKLRRQGVDVATRSAVGGVVAAGVGLGAFIPMAGGTVAKTAGLVAVGGPGLFVAQQAATREILGSAGFGQLASTYDPFDPVGLAVSTLIPAGFGAYGLRSARARVAREAAAADAAKMASPEPPSAMTATAQAARGYVDEATVDAARVAYAVEQRRSGSLAAADDLRGAAQDEAALAQAAAQMARGDRVEVSGLAPETAPRVALERMSEIAARLEEANAALLEEAQYHRYTHGDADTGIGYMMFAENRASVESAYGPNHYTFDTSNLPESQVVYAGSRQFRELVESALDRHPEVLREYQTDAASLAREVNPSDIVNSAQIWDAPDLVRIIRDEVLEPNGWRAVETDDGAIVFDRAAVRGNNGSHDAATSPKPSERPVEGVSSSPALDAGGVRGAVVAGYSGDSVNVAPAAAQVLGRLAAGDINSALRIAQEAMAKPGEPTQAPTVRLQGEAPQGAASIEQTRLASLEANNPAALDFEVVTNWDDKGLPTERMTAREYLAEVERLAGEEVADARLLDVAVQCALRG